MNRMVKIVMVMVAVMGSAISAIAQDNAGQDSVATEWGDTLQLQDVENRQKIINLSGLILTKIFR